MIEEVRVESSDGAQTSARVFTASGETAVLLLPAMGTEASYYDRVGAGLAARGVPAMIADLRGVGTSDQRPERARFGYEELVARDLPALCEAVRKRFLPKRLVILGHSLGAQIAALAASSGAYDALIVVAGGSVHYRAYPWRARPRVFFGTQMAAAIACGLGYFPGDRVGFGGRQPAKLIRDWARFGRTGMLRPTGASLDYEAEMARATLPVLGVSVEGDTLAPRTAMDALLAKLVNARIERRTVRLTEKKGDPHFRWARAPEPVLDVVVPFVSVGPS